MAAFFRKWKKVIVSLLLLWFILGFIYLWKIREQHLKNIEKNLEDRGTTEGLGENVVPNTTFADEEAVQGKTSPKLQTKSEKSTNINKVINREVVDQSTPELEDGLMSIIADERLYALEHGCRVMGQDYRLDIEALMKPTYNKPRFYFSDKYKLLFCEVPKCGSTTWKKLLLTMEGIFEAGIDPSTINGGLAHEEGVKLNFWSNLNASDPVSLARARERISNYTRVMTVREPLKRLVSAYKDKILPTGSGGETYAKKSKRIHDLYKDVNVSKNATQSDNTYASWEEFARYLIDPKKRLPMDPHWDFYSNFCHPCSAKYDYIIKLETAYTDIKYLSKVIGYDMTPYFPASKKVRLKKWNTEYSSYFLKLPKEQREKLYQMYLVQYLLYGYPKPEFS